MVEIRFKTVWLGGQHVATIQGRNGMYLVNIGTNRLISTTLSGLIQKIHTELGE